MTAQQSPPPGKYRLRVADYEMLADSGAFGDLRTELIEGEIVVMSPQFRPHAMAKQDLYDALRDALRAIGSSLRAIIEVSTEIDDHSLPLPDIVLTSEPYGSGAVPLSSVALVIEAADATLATDLRIKARLYARAGIPEYWVADVAGKRVVQMWSPGKGRYAESREVPGDGRVESMTIAGLVVPTPWT